MVVMWFFGRNAHNPHAGRPADAQANSAEDYKSCFFGPSAEGPLVDVGQRNRAAQPRRFEHDSYDGRLTCVVEARMW